MKWNHIDFPKTLLCVAAWKQRFWWSAVFEPNVIILRIYAPPRTICLQVTTHFLWCACVYTIHIGPIHCVTSLIHSSIVCITAKLSIERIRVCVCALMYLYISACVCVRAFVCICERKSYSYSHSHFSKKIKIIADQIQSANTCGTQYLLRIRAS